MTNYFVCMCKECQQTREEKQKHKPENSRYATREEVKAALLELLSDPDFLKALQYLADK